MFSAQEMGSCLRQGVNTRQVLILAKQGLWSKSPKPIGLTIHNKTQNAITPAVFSQPKNGAA